MNFRTALQSPVAVTIDGKDYTLTRMKLKDWAELGAYLDRMRQDAVTAHLDPMDRFRMLSIYSVAPLDFTELSQSAYGPVGAAFIVKRAFVGAGITEERAAQMVDAADPADLMALAIELSSVSEKKIAPPKTAAGIQKEVKKDPAGTFADETQEQSDPLASAARG